MKATNKGFVRMNYVYLDQNVIDTVDKGLENEIAKFLEKKILRGKNRGYGVNT
jgi:hypothetical protein